MEASNSAKVSRTSACIDWLSFSAARIRASTLVPASETSLISHLSLHKSSAALPIASRHCMCPARQLQHRLALCPGPVRIVSRCSVRSMGTMLMLYALCKGPADRALLVLGKRTLKTIRAHT
jgi:hypothetical protein